MQNQGFVIPKNVGIGIRLGSMLLDHFFMTIIAVIFGLPATIASFSRALNVSHDPFAIVPASDTLSYLGLVGFAFYFCKDCVQGRSLAKRILKLQVIDNKTGKVASPFQCFVRNIFCVIWPVEVVVTLSNPGRRIGDFVARTRVVPYDPQTVVQPKPWTLKVIMPVILSFGLLYLILLPFQYLQRLAFAASPKYVESSYNPIESKEIETLFADSLGTMLSASVRVYDSVEEEQVKYVSIVCTLKENYLDEEGTRKQLTDLTKELLYSWFPENTIAGRAKYVYREPGFVQTTSHDLGRPVKN